MKHVYKILIAVIVALSANAQAGGDAAAGKIIAAEKCVACHGVDGNNDNPQFPRLAGQHADYLERALQDYKSGARANPIMAGQATVLSKQDMKNLSAWFASQSGVTTPVELNTVSK